MQLRWYQSEAVEAAWSYLTTQPGNPVIVLPTGAGKSVVIGQLSLDAVERWNGRVLVLAHRKELLEQNAEKLRVVGCRDVGIYSAGLRRRDTEHQVLVAGVQSVFRRADELGERNLVIVDEAHLVPMRDEGMYRELFDGLRAGNPRMRVVGTTATPFRLDCGPLCRPDGLFHKICYSADIARLIEDGFLCRLTTRPASVQADTSGLTVRAGEFAAGEAERLFSQASIVDGACAEIAAKTVDRKSVLVFCAGLVHADHVAERLEGMGCQCGVVTGDTPDMIRAATLSDFRAGRLKYLLNVDVLTTGFDAPNIDCICLLRATMSAGLYAQMCGRGFRVCLGKTDCLVLDFGQNIERHGPLDAIDFGRCKRTGVKAGEAPVKECPNCGDECYASARECGCGWRFPPPERTHDVEADTESQILSEPETLVVEEVYYSVHQKRRVEPDQLPTMRVDYVCTRNGAPEPQPISEWVCFEHGGYPLKRAAQWWKARSFAPFPTSVEDAVDLGRRGAIAPPRSITVRREGRWWRVLAYDLDEIPEEWADEVMVGDPWDDSQEF